MPGLYIADLGPGQSQVAIRGISAGQVVRDQPGVKESVGIYLDESPISVALFTPDLDLYDLDRVEVLRGPQGTLFGAGSSSGTVRYITAQPNIGEFGGSVDLTGNAPTDGEFGGSVHGSINVPIGENAAMRAVGYYTALPGFIDSVYPDRSTREDVNSGTRTGGRLAFRFEPNENFSITPRVVYQKLETDGYPRIDVYNILGNTYTTTETAVDPGERGQVTQFREGITDDFMMADLKLDFGLGGDLGMTAVTTYIDRQVEVLRDASQLTGSVTIDLGGTADDARLNSPLYDDTDLQVFSQEIRLASTGEGAFQWLVGAFYQQSDRKYGQTLPTPGYDALTQDLIGADSSDFNAPPDTPFYSRLSYDFQQFALFGEATYRFSPHWRSPAACATTTIEEDRLLTFAGLFADQGYTDQPGSVSSDGVSPRVILAFSPTEDVQLTAQVAAGLPAGRHQRPAQRGPVLGRRPGDLQRSPGIRGRDHDQLRDRHQDAPRRRPRDVQRSGVLHRDRGPAGDRGCGHLLVAHRAQRAGREQGRGDGTVRAAERELGPRALGDLCRRGDHRRLSTRPADRWHPRRQSPADVARAAGCRPPAPTTGT